MKNICLIFLVLTLPLSTWAVKKTNVDEAGVAPREYWVQIARQLSEPVLQNMSRGTLQKNMKLELSPSFDSRDPRVGYMECFGRLMAGIAPWLATGECEELRQQALMSYSNAVDPESPDCLLWQGQGQLMVDAAYIAESFLRAWDGLWQPLDEATKRRYIANFKGVRAIDPPYTNWILFSAIIEAFMAKATYELDGQADFDEYRVNSAIRKVEEWYVGDGWYSDGPSFAFDYYSCYVFHPMYLETLQAMADAKVNSRIDYNKYYDRALLRAQKMAVILERFISPEGTFPVFGRSIPYRMAALQPLAMMAWLGQLPSDLNPAQVRCALTQVMHRMYDEQENFNKDGFLTIGFCGSQPDVADWYTNNGSLYMTSLSLLPLGLPADDAFWSDADEPWTQMKAWGGQPFPKDHQWKDDTKISDKW